jgi:hypothetical protein
MKESASPLNRPRALKQQFSVLGEDRLSPWGTFDLDVFGVVRLEESSVTGR